LEQSPQADNAVIRHDNEGAKVEEPITSAEKLAEEPVEPSKQDVSEDKAEPGISYISSLLRVLPLRLVLP